MVNQILRYHSNISEASVRFFKEHLVRAIQYAERYRKSIAVLFVDLDGFKRVNDTLGHDMGDKLLKDVAHRQLRNVKDLFLQATG